VVLEEVLDIPLPPVTFPLDAMDTPLVRAASNHAMSNSSQYLTTLCDRVFNTQLAGLQISCFGTQRMLCKEQFNARGLWNDGVFPYLGTSINLIFMLTTSDGIVADPGTLHSCARQLS